MAVTDLVMGKPGETRAWAVDGPGGKTWSVWDFGDELTVHEGVTITDRVAVRVPPEVAKRMAPWHRRDHVVDAIGAIHVAKLLGSDRPTFHKLWR